MTLSRDSHSLSLEALVVNDLDVDVLAGIPFMARNDISIRPTKHQITICDTDVEHYDNPTLNSPQNHVRRTQAFVLRSGSSSTVIWPGNFIELSLPSDIAPDSCLSVEPRIENAKPSRLWSRPHVTEAVNDKIRIFNDSDEPQQVNKHDHFCTAIPEHSPSGDIPPVQVSTDQSNFGPYSSTVSVDPDKILPVGNRAEFSNLIHEYDDVFNPQITEYNDTVGKFHATVNMGPV